MITRRTWILCLCVVIAVGLLATWVTRLAWLPWMSTALIVSDPLQYAPAVLLLPGSEDIRPQVAASLVKAGYADRVLIPETRANPDVLTGQQHPTTELTRQFLVQRGITRENIVILEGSSDSTFDDAQVLKNYFAVSGPTDIIVVTSAYHTRRAQWVFHHVLAEDKHHLRFYAAPNGFDTRHWWTSRKGRRAILSELLKLPFYVVYHGFGWFWVAVLTLVGGMFILRRLRSSVEPHKD